MLKKGGTLCEELHAKFNSVGLQSSETLIFLKLVEVQKLSF